MTTIIFTRRQTHACLLVKNLSTFILLDTLLDCDTGDKGIHCWTVTQVIREYIVVVAQASLPALHLAS